MKRIEASIALGVVLIVLVSAAFCGEDQITDYAFNGDDMINIGNDSDNYLASENIVIEQHIDKESAGCADCKGSGFGIMKFLVFFRENLPSENQSSDKSENECITSCVNLSIETPMHELSSATICTYQQMCGAQKIINLNAAAE